MDAVARRQRTVAATRRRDFPDRRVPRAVRDRGTVWILLRVAATSHIVGSGHGRVAACLALGLVRDAIAHRAIVGSGGGHESGEREEENARHGLFILFLVKVFSGCAIRDHVILN